MKPFYVPQFTGDTFMTLNLEEKLSKDMSISVDFRTFRQDGKTFSQLLYTSHTS